MKRELRFRRSRAAIRDEMRDEIAQHVELAAESLMRRGVEREEAWRRARERFGDFEAAMQTLYHSAEHRDGMMRRREYLGAIRQDLTISLRQMRRSPVVAAAITITLALGIGANLVMFGIANRLLFAAPTGVAGADALRILDLPQGGTYPRSPVTNYATMLDLQQASSFASLGGYTSSGAKSLGRGARAEPITVASASATFFSTLGVRPALGRFFSVSEDKPPRGDPVVVISYEFWQRKFGRDSSAISATLPIEDRNYRIVGVAPPHFTGLELAPVDVWITLTEFSASLTPDFLTDRGSKWMTLVARLKPGVSDERAIAEVSRLFAISQEARRAPQLAVDLARPAGTDPTMKEAGIGTAAFRSVMPGRSEGRTSQAARVSLWLVGVAVVVLLIACANVATLLLTRAMRRTAEMAVRLALGVSRRRLIAQLVAESAVFATIGAAAALFAAYVSRGVIQSVLLPQTDLGPAVSLPVMALGAAIVVVICILTSVAPALQVLRVDLATSLKGASGQFSESRRRLRSTLLVAQVAMSAMLLVGAGLFVRSLENAKHKRLGIDMDRAVLAEVAVYSSGYDFNRQKQYWDEALRRVRRLPGVANASVTIGIPLRFSLSGRFIVPGLDRLPTLSTGGPYRNGVDANFFATTGARIIRGRGFTDNDRATTTPVIVINQTLAKAIAGAGEPLGKCVKVERVDSLPCATIVGVVEDITRHGVKEEPSMQYYLPKDQWRSQYSLAMIVRAEDGEARRLIAPVTKALQEVAPDVPYPRVRTYEEVHAPELQSWRLGATMFTLFGALAFVVAIVGLYGLLAYNVASRQYEFGIRTALGARTADIVAIVVKGGLALVTAGLVIGLAVAAGAAKYVGPMLYDVAPRDMMVYAGSAVLMLLVTVLVAAIPARRASAVSPTLALRNSN